MAKLNTALNGKVIAITGASQGVGLATAKALAMMGASVILLARNQQALDEAVEIIGKDKATAFSVDIANDESLTNTFQAIDQQFGKLDGLINNAGLARPNRIEDLPASELMMQVNTNFTGTVLCCKYAIPLLRKGDDPLIVNVSSASARSTDEMSHLSIYSSSKAAVERFSIELRAELREDGIGVSVFSPGAITTEFGAGWDMEKLTLAIRAWHKKGPHIDGWMAVETVAESLAHCFTYPKGTYVDFIEIRPNTLTDKPVF